VRLKLCSKQNTETKSEKRLDEGQKNKAETAKELWSVLTCR